MFGGSNKRQAIKWWNAMDFFISLARNPMLYIYFIAETIWQMYDGNSGNPTHKAATD